MSMPTRPMPPPGPPLKPSMAGAAAASEPQDGDMVPPTIFALASGHGPSAVAVLRISGPRAGAVLKALCGGLPPARRASVRRLVDSRAGVLDEALVLWFPAPNSFTGEDVAELHLHGGRATVAAMIRHLGRQKGLKPAEPGAFTRRAFDNGRLDLTQAEALADLVAAETEAQRRLALRDYGGASGQRAEFWRQRLIAMLSLVEASLDFSDEDLPEDLLAPLIPQILGLKDELLPYIDDEGRGERLRQGLRVALLGAPNAGKSSLLNRLARRDVAIVSPEAGTTRDAIEVPLDLGGWPLTLIDTAGLRDTRQSVEAEGIRRAEGQAASADLVVCLFDLSGERPFDERTARHASRAEGPCLVVLNKCDAVEPSRIARVTALACDRFGSDPVILSARDGTGFDALESALQAAAARLLTGASEMILTRARHRQALRLCCEALDRAGSALQSAHAAADPEGAGSGGMAFPELVAEDLRLAAAQLGRITGRIDVEDVLDSLFSRFCIGK